MIKQKGEIKLQDLNLVIEVGLEENAIYNKRISAVDFVDMVLELTEKRKSKKEKTWD